MSKDAMRTAMLRAIEAAVKKEGSRVRVAELLGITRQAMQQWDTVDGKYRVPPKHVLRLEGMSAVSRYELRPDIYGPAPKRARPNSRAQARAAFA